MFVAYQLWGTGIYTAQAQNDLRDQFEQAQRAARTTTTTSPTATTPTTTTAVDDPVVPTTTTLAPFAAPPAGRGRGVDRDPQDRRGRRDRRGGERRRPPQGAGPLPEHTDARARGQQRDRRPPDHLQPPLRRSRPTRERRRHPRHHRAGRLPLQGHRDPRGRSERGQRARPVARSGAARSRPGHADAHHVQPEVLGLGTADRSRAVAAPTRPAGTAAAHRGGQGEESHHHRRPVGRVVVAHTDDPLGRDHVGDRVCCGGCCSTVTRVGRRGSSAWCRSWPRCSSPTCTSSGCCPRTTELHDALRTRR